MGKCVPRKISVGGPTSNSLLKLHFANLALPVRRKNVQSVTHPAAYLTVNEAMLRDRGPGLVPSPDINFGWLFPTCNWAALDIC